MSDTIRIIIVDDHQMFIDGIRSLLAKEKHIRVEATMNNALEVMPFLEKNSIDLVISDISMPHLSGTELVKLIKDKFPEIKTLVLSMHNDPETIREILQAESEGYILKNTGKKELIEAIKKIMGGSTYYSDEVMRSALMRMKKESAPPDQEALTPREIEIIQCIADDLSSAQIAERLSISIRTVDTHRKNILGKLGCRSVVGLIKYAFTHNLASWSHT